MLMSTQRLSNKHSGPRRSILDQTELVTIPELAHFLRQTPHAVHMQRLRGQMPGSLGFRVGARVLFKPEDIRAWLNECQAAQVRELDLGR
jgi:hypothetical protein